MIKGDSMKENENRLNDAALDEISGGGAYGPDGPYHVYTVADGDTIDSIALRFLTSATILIKLNDIAYPYRIKAGQSLLIPRR